MCANQMLAVYSSGTSDALHILASSSRNRKVVHSMLCGINHLFISSVLRHSIASHGFAYTACWWVVNLILQVSSIWSETSSSEMGEWQKKAVTSRFLL